MYNDISSYQRSTHDPLLENNIFYMYQTIKKMSLNFENSNL